MDGFLTRPALPSDVDELVQFWSVAGENATRPADRPDLAPELRSQGLGRHMLELGERRLTELGGERMCAMVLEDNDLGQGLWRAAGYTRQEEWSRWVKPTSSS